ncbi:hypothetical protein SCALM49S_05702 [Streptomyces californicus]
MADDEPQRGPSRAVQQLQGGRDLDGPQVFRVGGRPATAPGQCFGDIIAVDVDAALDSAIGDADHGSNLQRGFAAVKAVLEKDAPATPGALLALAGRQLISTVGGASGPL